MSSFALAIPTQDLHEFYLHGLLTISTLNYIRNSIKLSYSQLAQFQSSNLQVSSKQHMGMGSSLPEQHFTFASPTISEAYEDALDFDYESWIEQSKSSYHSSQDDKWMDAEAIRRHHQEMVLRAADLPEEAYELSLRDLTELPRAANGATGCVVKKGTLGSTRSIKSWRKRLSRNETMEGAGLIVKMFMPSPSGGRKKRSSGSTVAAVQKSVSINADGDGSIKNTAAETGNESDNTRSNSMPNEGHQDSSYNRYV